MRRPIREYTPWFWSRGGLGVGWAKLEELRADILNFNNPVSQCMRSLRGVGTKEYYLATAADKVFMSPEDELDVKGLRAELMFFKGDAG